MKTTFFTICLYFLSSQVSAWTDAHVKAINEACVKSAGDFPYKNRVSFCSCSIEMTVKLFTKDQVVKMQRNGTIKTNENYLKLVDYCYPKLFE